MHPVRVITARFNCGNPYIWPILRTICSTHSWYGWIETKYSNTKEGSPTLYLSDRIMKWSPINSQPSGAWYQGYFTLVNPGQSQDLASSGTIWVWIEWNSIYGYPTWLTNPCAKTYCENRLVCNKSTPLGVRWYQLDSSVTNLRVDLFWTYLLNSTLLHGSTRKPNV